MQRQQYPYPVSIRGIPAINKRLISQLNGPHSTARRYESEHFPVKTQAAGNLSLGEMSEQKMKISKGGMSKSATCRSYWEIGRTDCEGLKKDYEGQIGPELLEAASFLIRHALDSEQKI